LSGLLRPDSYRAMDPVSFAILVKAMAPVLGVLVLFGIPAVIVFTLKYFKLRQRELELEAELHGKQTQVRLASIEARLGTIEAALGAPARGAGSLQDRLSMMEPPSASEEMAASSDPKPVRTR